MTLALFIFGPRLALVFVDLNVRFMVIVAGIAGFAVASVLMFYKGPDRES